MEFLHNAVDYGDAPFFFATGVRRAFLISPHVVRVTFVRTDRSKSGAEEQRVSGHIDWDVASIKAAKEMITEVITTLIEMEVLEPDDD